MHVSTINENRIPNISTLKINKMKNQDHYRNMLRIMSHKGKNRERK
jgi:hypothetical protein